MENAACKDVIASYGWTNTTVNTITSGLINHTWKVHTDSGDFILQRINTDVFTHPEQIDENMTRIASWLAVHAPGYRFTAPVKNKAGISLIQLEGAAYRAFEFQQNTHTIAVVTHAEEAFEAAKQFALFTQQLAGFPAAQLHITLPDFHNLALRFQQFETALRNNNEERFVKAAATAYTLHQLKEIVARYNRYIGHPEARQRVMHHDTKISNVLFNEAGRSVCVIDLDTVMPGHLFSDAGDMFRTYLPPVSEEEADLDKLYIRNNVFEAIETGYLGTLKYNISSFETAHFYLSGEIMIYMQALRFLTDYLEDDRYYGKKYPDQNLVRAKNQLRLLELYQEAIG
ncbi:MAG: aminoglycoside phosphotransferase family protein [Sphingobacteriia bacterium]|nr:aminoglycoside phosphotransferase family protein [Sphingobacteriia bacterium]